MIYFICLVGWRSKEKKSRRGDLIYMIRFNFKLNKIQDIILIGC